MEKVAGAVINLRHLTFGGADNGLTMNHRAKLSRWRQAETGTGMGMGTETEMPKHVETFANVR